MKYSTCSHCFCFCALALDPPCGGSGPMMPRRVKDCAMSANKVVCLWCREDLNFNAHINPKQRIADFLRDHPSNCKPTTPILDD